ncbi:MAG: PsiF family protein [Steroidobacteraceae bacterium]
MKCSTWLVAVSAALAVVAGQSAVAQAQHPNGQQTRMTTCNADAKTQALKGADRKAFMKTCLSDKGAAAAPAKTLNSQQEKMKTCNADAKTKSLKGADRKAFMKTCLSGSPK